MFSGGAATSAGQGEAGSPKEGSPNQGKCRAHTVIHIYFFSVQHLRFRGILKFQLQRGSKLLWWLQALVWNAGGGLGLESDVQTPQVRATVGGTWGRDLGGGL